MSIDLLSHNRLGSISNIHFVLRNVISKKQKSITDIKKYCADKSIDLSYSINGILALLEFTEIVVNIGDFISFGNETDIDTLNNLSKDQLSQLLFSRLFQGLKKFGIINEIFPFDKIKFDINENRIYLQSNSIPLKYSPIKNFLLANGYLSPGVFPNFLYIDHSLENFFENELINLIADEFKEKFFEEDPKKALSIEEFQELQQLRNKVGIEAEEYVLNFERARLSFHPKLNLVRRISNFDVSAGYDIISFENESSQYFDRFIEVKSYSNIIEFFWSKNEIETSEQKGENYFLYLVDRNNINQPDYIPIIICNPFIEIFKNQVWQKVAQNWQIKPLIPG
jgi:hypothetical protein